MRKLLVIAAATSMMLIGGCLGSSSTGPASASDAPAKPAIATADMVIMTGARAFGVAELTYQTLAEGARGLIRAGAIKGQDAAKVAAIARDAQPILERGKATADAALKARMAADLFGLADRLKSLTKRE